MIKIVVFDMDGVLCRYRIERRLALLASWSGQQPGRDPRRHLALGVRGRGGARGPVGGRLLAGIRRAPGLSPQRRPVGGGPEGGD